MNTEMMVKLPGAVQAFLRIGIYLGLWIVSCLVVGFVFGAMWRLLKMGWDMASTVF